MRGRFRPAGDAEIATCAGDTTYASASRGWPHNKSKVFSFQFSVFSSQPQVLERCSLEPSFSRIYLPCFLTFLLRCLIASFLRTPCSTRVNSSARREHVKCEAA